VVEWVAMAALVVLLLLIAAHYLRKSLRVLRQTTPAYEMLPDERVYLRRQAWRRVVNSGLMLVLAGLLVGSYAFGLQERADAIGRQREQQAVDGQKPPATEDQREFGRLFAGYVIAILLLLGSIVILAGLDFFATRRYALTQLRKIQTDRRAMLERQITRWREERDGPSLNS
jgi:hypothetical protein